MGNNPTTNKKGSGDSAAESSGRNGAPQIGIYITFKLTAARWIFTVCDEFSVKEFLEKAKEEFEEKWKRNPTVRVYTIMRDEIT